MRLVTPSQMRELDSRAIQEIGIPSMVLMENAGLSLVDEVERRLPRGAGQGPAKISVVCGPGNNGGDGMVAARHLADRGHEVMVFLTARKGSFRGDARSQLRILGNLGLPVKVVHFPADMEMERKRLGDSDIVIDALFGTGLHRDIDGLSAESVRAINACPGIVVSADIPSGINGHTGLPMGEAVMADVTVTFGYPKLGLVLYPGAHFAGEVVVADIGIPAAAENGTEFPGEIMGPEPVISAFSPRWEDSHKGTFGHLLVCSGSMGKTGAGILAARAALASGAGLVTLALPVSAVWAVDAAVPEIMTAPIPETSDGTLSANGKIALKQLVGERSAMAIGPGLTVQNETAELVREVLSWEGFPVVADADALNALNGNPESLRKRKGKTVLTPHPGEMARLLDMSSSMVQEDRVGAALSCAGRSGCVVVLKGAGTVVATPDGRFFINPTGNPGMATAGAGDVLTGMIGALLARGEDALTSALASVYLHGVAGDLAAEALTQHSLTAVSILDNIGCALKKILFDLHGA